MAESSETVVEDSDIYHDFACTLCAENDRNVEALKRCEECAENLCGECLRNHNMFKKMRKHTLVDKAEAGEPVALNIKGGKGQDGKDDAALSEVPKVRCESHPGNRIELYCEDHDEVGCSTCTGLNHKLCENMHYIPAMAVGFKSSDEPYAEAKSVDTLIRKTKGLKETEENVLRQITEERNAAVDLINEQAEFIKEKADHLKDNAIKDVDGHFKEIEKAVKEDINKSDDVISILEAEKKKFNSEIDINESELFIYTKQGKATRTKIEHVIQELDTSIVKRPFKVIVDDTVTACLSKLDTLASINKSVQDCQSSDIMPGEEEGQCDILAASVTPDQARHDERKKPLSEKLHCYTPDLSFSLEDTPKVRARADRNGCDIVDCCLLKNGSFLLIDGSNNCLNFFDSSYKVLFRRKLQDSPLAGCSVGEHEVAVSLNPNDIEEFIQFATVTYNNKIHLTSSFVIGEICRGLSFANQKLFLSCGGLTSKGESPGHVRVYSLGGCLLQTIKSSTQQQYTITVPYGISAANNGHCIVTNYRQGVLAFDSDGELVWRFQHPDLTRASGVCEVDNRVLVSCVNTGNIFEISQEGQVSRLLMHGSAPLEDAVSLSYNESDNKLFVSKLKCDHVLVYKRE